jgi:hypothetical protein
VTTPEDLKQYVFLLSLADSEIEQRENPKRLQKRERPRKEMLKIPTTPQLRLLVGMMKN